MRKFKSFIFIGAAVFFLCGMTSLAEEKCVFDQADLLNDQEEEALEKLAKEYSEEWDMNFLAVTTEDAEGKSSREYADDFYDTCFPDASEEDGVLYLIDMENREIYLSASGEAIRYLSLIHISEPTRH